LNALKLRKMTREKEIELKMISIPSIDDMENTLMQA
jgi:hypothetical protein